MDSVFITTRKQRIIRELRDYMLIALGMLMYAIGWTVFLLPNDLPSGAVRYCFYCLLGYRFAGSVHLFGNKRSIVDTFFGYFGMEV